MVQRSQTSGFGRTSTRRTLFHVLALVMMIIQSLPLGTAVAASTTGGDVPTSAAAVLPAPIAVPCVAEAPGDAAQGRDALDCALDVGDAASIATNLVGLVRRNEGVTPEFKLVDEPDHGTASIVGSTLTYTPTIGFRGEDAIGYRVSDSTGLLAGGTVRLRVDGQTSTMTTATTAATATPSSTATKTRETSRTSIVATPAMPTPTVNTVTTTPLPSVVSEDQVGDAPQPPSDPAVQPQAVATPVNTGMRAMIFSFYSSRVG